ncbi:hypothetical protein [Mangrovimonas sp. YM274]|uniref:hypothetical protein n=1 Tax=Mangrovimonas sp. YM274 TaxID=3070660 RepID=UPI0027DD299F|nr:hypothetical protein [Mangrovimonas sp. YM274]WMI67309.1 hypothetical protein RBH95_09130 [Mangrovimonas sp. YM274]
MNLKHELLSACLEHVNKRIVSYKNEIELIKEAIESYDKSGDEDDDSGSGKLFDDLEKNGQHLADASKALDTLKLINPNLKHDSAVLGSLVTTNSATFYLAVSIGKIELNSKPYLVISLNSPIGMLLKNKTIGDAITFNSTTYTIKGIG